MLKLLAMLMLSALGLFGAATTAEAAPVVEAPVAELPMLQALAPINNTWTPWSIGACKISMKQPFTNVVQLRIDNGNCYKLRLQGWVDGNQYWQCRNPTGGGYLLWPKYGAVYKCEVWSVRLGATNVNLCYVEVAGYDINNRFYDGLYLRGGRIV